MTDPLHIKYRPQSLDDVIGQDAAVKNIARLFEADRVPHCFLLTGPSGCGKTTLARIVASMLGCERTNLIEVDAARFSGVDAMRELVTSSQYTSLSGSAVKVHVIDECFAPSTEIETSRGRIQIKDVCIGDYVVGIGGTRRVIRVFKNKVRPARVIQVCLANGDRLICSKEHAFLTPGGWVPAKKLINFKSVLTVRANVSPHMLNMWDCIYERGWWGAILQCGVSRKEILSCLWKHLFHKSKNMLSCVWLCYCRTKAKRPTLGCVARRNKAWNKPIHDTNTGTLERSVSAIIQTDAREQPGLPNGRGGKDERNETEKWHPSCMERAARGQWQFNTAAKTARALFAWVGHRILHQNLRSIGGLSCGIQSRFGASGSKTGSGNRWTEPFIQKGTSNRQKEDRQTATVGVVSVTHYERGCGFESEISLIEDSETGQYCTFYDLEIEGRPSYLVAQGIVVHNCHALSKTAWQPLLLATEEPAPHVYWCLCTTEAEKVPATIRTRSHAYDLKPVRWDVLAELLAAVRDAERLQVKPEFIDLAARRAQGSVRQGLVFLSCLDGIVEKDEALRLVEDAEAQEEGPVVLARMIANNRGFTWAAACAQLELLDTSPETIRLTVLNYAQAAALKTTHEKQAVRLLAVMQAFASPCNASERMAPILLAIGTLLFGE